MVQSICHFTFSCRRPYLYIHTKCFLWFYLFLNTNKVDTRTWCYRENAPLSLFSGKLENVNGLRSIWVDEYLWSSKWGHCVEFRRVKPPCECVHVVPRPGVGLVVCRMSDCSFSWSGLLNCLTCCWPPRSHTQTHTHTYPFRSNGCHEVTECVCVLPHAGYAQSV